MLKKIILITTIGTFLASNPMQAQGFGNIAVQNTALQLEAGRNSPVLCVIPAKTQVELLDYVIDKSENRCQAAQHYLTGNLYIKINHNGLQGFVPAYFFSESESLNQLKTMASPDRPPLPNNDTAKDKEKSKDNKPTEKAKGKKSK